MPWGGFLVPSPALPATPSRSGLWAEQASDPPGLVKGLQSAVRAHEVAGLELPFGGAADSSCIPQAHKGNPAGARQRCRRGPESQTVCPRGAPATEAGYSSHQVMLGPVAPHHWRSVRCQVLTRTEHHRAIH